MLYVVDKSVADHFSAGKATAEDVLGIDYLTMGIAEGNHRIGGFRTTLQSIASHKLVPIRAKQVLERAALRVGQEAGLWEKLTVYGLVLAGAGAGRGPASASIANQRLLRFPLRWFDTSGKVQPTVLLAENLSDGHVLALMAKAALAIKKLPFLPLNHDMR